MNLSPINRPTRLIPRTILLAALSLLLAMSAEGSVWPDLPPVTALDNPDPGFKFAAGLYNSQEALSDGHMTNHDKELLARAFLSAGRMKEAIALEDDGLIPSRDLAIQFRLSEEGKWKNLEERIWTEIFRESDGESRYWRAKMAKSKGRNIETRSLLERILRENPASIFVPVSQELLASLPFEDEGPHVKPPRIHQGIRVQWGVFRDASRARKQRSVIEAYGQTADILTFERDGIPLSRVVSDPFATREEARHEGESLRKRYGIEYVIYAEEAGGE